MPYISTLKRLDYANAIEELRNIPNAGHLNFIITSIINNFLEKSSIKYETLNACIGVLECAKLELYRKVAAEYEDTKEIKNGTVYTCKKYK
jgi:hypothetical protein